MTWFHFCTANHNKVGRPTLGEMAKWFEAGLLDLGHEVTFSERYIEYSAINIFWESFNYDFNRQLRDAKINFGIIGTEIPDGSGFNWRNDKYWRERFESFEEIAPDASFIWTTVESAVPYYGGFCPAAYIELGFSERLLPVHQNDNPDIDFFFYGLNTPYRRSAVEKIRRYAKVEWPNKFLNEVEVANIISRSKIGLNFKQSEHWPIPSPTRLGRLILAKRGVAAEFVPSSTRQGELVGICPADVDFADYALGVLHSDWKSRAERAFDLYRETMQMKDIMRTIISSTISVSFETARAPSVPQRALEWLEPPQHLLSLGCWNVVYWNNRYFGLHKKLGEIDVSAGEKGLVTRYGARYILCFSEMDQLKEEILKVNSNFLYRIEAVTYKIERIIRWMYKSIRKGNLKRQRRA